MIIALSGDKVLSIVNQGEIVLDILSRASHTFPLTGKRFMTMVQSSDPHMHFGKLGVLAVSRVTWRGGGTINQRLAAVRSLTSEAADLCD
jgi:hypothetical protein